jgi:hypothetical protein
MSHTNAVICVQALQRTTAWEDCGSHAAAFSRSVMYHYASG